MSNPCPPDVFPGQAEARSYTMRPYSPLSSDRSASASSSSPSRASTSTSPPTAPLFAKAFLDPTFVLDLPSTVQLPQASDSSSQAVSEAVELDVESESSSPARSQSISTHPTSPGSPLGDEDTPETGSVQGLSVSDARLFKRNISNSVFEFVPDGKDAFAQVLQDIGSPKLLSLYEQRKKSSVAEVDGVRLDLGIQILKGLKAEGKSGTPRHQIDGKYWLEGLADRAPVHDSPFAWHSGENEVPDRTTTIRQPNASLRASAATTVSWRNILIPVEFTPDKCPSFRRDGTPQACPKLQRAILNASDAMRASQRTRAFAVGLAFFGRTIQKPDNVSSGNVATLVVFALDHESLRLYVVPDIAGERLGDFGAFIATLRDASIYDLGYSPLFEYHSFGHLPSLPDVSEVRLVDRDIYGTIKAQQQYGTLGDIIPTHLSMPRSAMTSPSASSPWSLDEPLIIIGTPLSHSPETPISRSTFVTRVLVRGSDGLFGILAVKIQYVREERAWRETAVLERLWGEEFEPLLPAPSMPPSLIVSTPSIASSLPTPPSPVSTPSIAIGLSSRTTPDTSKPCTADPDSSPNYAPQLIAAFAAEHHPTPDGVHRQRHIELMLMLTPPDAVSLFDADAPSCTLAIRYATDALHHAALRGVFHGDISTGNVLASASQGVVLIDWECGRFEQSSRGEASSWTRLDERERMMGTRDTMAAGLLDGDSHVVAHDVEALLNVFYKILTTRIVPAPAEQKAWCKLVDGLGWGWDALTYEDHWLALVRREFYRRTACELASLLYKSRCNDAAAEFLDAVEGLEIHSWKPKRRRFPVTNKPIVEPVDMTEARWTSVKELLASVRDDLAWGTVEEVER